jgi:hypothetical protein
MTGVLDLFLEGLMRGGPASVVRSRSLALGFSISFSSGSISNRHSLPINPSHGAVKMASRKSPPEFVENLSWLTLLSPEEIRLAKRNTDSPSLVSHLCSNGSHLLFFHFSFHPDRFSR